MNAIIAKMPSKLSKDEREKVRGILSQTHSFIDNELFHRADAYSTIFTCEIDMGGSVEVVWNQHLAAVSSGINRSAIGSNKKYTLDSGEERSLFLQFNYARYMVHNIVSSALTPKRARSLIIWHDRAFKYRSTLLVANLGLIAAMARKYKIILNGEFYSHAYESLLKAVDKFDISRNIKFSTYGCRGIFTGLRNAQREARRSYVHQPRSKDGPVDAIKIDSTDFGTELLHELRQESEDLVHAAHIGDFIDAFNRNEAGLSPYERAAISRRFLTGHASELRQIGADFDLSAERIRQLIKSGLAKLRACLHRFS